MNKFVGFVSHQGRIYALTEDGKIYEVVIDVFGATEITLLAELPKE